MVEIIPAILSTNPADYHKKFKAVESFTDWIQIDIVDDKFARNLTVGPKEVGAIRTLKKLEIHLMVDFIEDWIDPFIEIRAKANIARIIVPYESCRDPIGVINHIRRHNLEVGFSINPDTPTSKLQHVVDKVDVVLLLSVYPGFSGQHFVHGTFKKIKQLKNTRPDISIEVDGGIEPGTARKCAEAGADILAAGSFIFEHARKGGTRSTFENDKMSMNQRFTFAQSGSKMEGNTYKEKVKKALNTLKEDVNI